MMTQQINLTALKINPKSLILRMSIGALIGLVPISLLLLSVKEPSPDWGRLWMLRPLIIVPLAGAFGSLFFYSVNFVRDKAAWVKVLVVALSMVAFIIVLWMGTILGLDGTLWN